MTQIEIKKVNSKIKDVQKSLTMAELSLNLLMKDIESVNLTLEDSLLYLQKVCSHKNEDGTSAVKGGTFFDKCHICGEEW